MSPMPPQNQQEPDKRKNREEQNRKEPKKNERETDQIIMDRSQILHRPNSIGHQTIPRKSMSEIDLNSRKSRSQLGTKIGENEEHSHCSNHHVQRTTRG